MNRFTRSMHVKAIPMWSDNYAYLLTSKSGDAWIIDPSEPKSVLPSLASANLRAIVNTHHHLDHSGGNAELKLKYPTLPVIGGSQSPLVEQTPKDGAVLQLGDIKITAIHTPCHTQDSICWYAVEGDERAVFTGDTLFNAGCGRFFEGNASEMVKAFAKLKALPPQTKVYSGHEYTKSNAKFAQSILGKDCDSLVDYCNKHKVTAGVFTIGDELKHNPFMRVWEKEIQTQLGVSDEVEAMNALRELKNKL